MNLGITPQPHASLKQKLATAYGRQGCDSSLRVAEVIQETVAVNNVETPDPLQSFRVLEIEDRRLDARQ